MLHIDIKRVEPGSMGDAGDLDAGGEPNRHGRDDLVAGEVLPDIVAQDIAGAAHADEVG